MLEQLVNYNDLGLFILRLSVAAIFFYHAIPKLKNTSGMAKMAGMPSLIILFLGIIELLSSIGLILGVSMQLSALLLSAIMVGATSMKIVKWHVPFAAMDKTGWEFDLILFAAAAAILLSGGGTIGL